MFRFDSETFEYGISAAHRSSLLCTLIFIMGELNQRSFFRVEDAGGEHELRTTNLLNLSCQAHTPAQLLTARSSSHIQEP